MQKEIQQLPFEKAIYSLLFAYISFCLGNSWVPWCPSGRVGSTFWILPINPPVSNTRGPLHQVPSSQLALLFSSWIIVQHKNIEIGQQLGAGNQRSAVINFESKHRQYDLVKTFSNLYFLLQSRRQRPTLLFVWKIHLHLGVKKKSMGRYK